MPNRALMPPMGLPDYGLGPMTERSRRGLMPAEMRNYDPREEIARGSMVPIAQYADGSFGPAVPTAAQAAGSFVAGLPGAMVETAVETIPNMLRPGYDYSNTQQAAQDSFDAAGLVAMGGSPFALARGGSSVGMFGGKLMPKPSNVDLSGEISSARQEIARLENLFAKVRKQPESGLRKPPKPEVPTTGDQAELDALRQSISELREKSDVTASAVPNAGPQIPMDMRNELVSAVAENPYVRAIPGVQGLPTKADQMKLLDEAIRSGAKYPGAKGPWGGLADPHNSAAELIAEYQSRQLAQNTSPAPIPANPAANSLPQPAPQPSAPSLVPSQNPLPSDYTRIARQAINKAITDNPEGFNPPYRTGGVGPSTQGRDMAVNLLNQGFEEGGMPRLPMQELGERYDMTMQALMAAKQAGLQATDRHVQKRAFGQPDTLAVPAAIGAGAAMSFDDALADYQQFVIDTDGDGIPDAPAPLRAPMSLVPALR